MIKKLRKLILEFWDISLIIFAIIILTVLLLLIVIDIAKYIATLVGLLSALFINIIKTIKNRKRLLLVSLTTNYINGSFIDDFLGELIGSNLNKKKNDPIEIFFDSLLFICNGKNPELRRRIAEALPALFQIDTENSKRVIEILRFDWDNKWKSDIRRRTIEALPLIIKKEKEFVKENILKIDVNDEIYTLIAIIEVVYIWRSTYNKKEAGNIFQKLVQKIEIVQSDNHYNISQLEIQPKELLTSGYELLNIIGNNTKKSIDIIDEIINEDSNFYLQVFIARNILRLCDYYPTCQTKCCCKGSPHIVLKYIQYFLQVDKHRYLRRPMAKENMIDCLINMLKRKDFYDIVKSIIWKIIKDKDIMVRRPAFDKISKIFEVDYEFGNSLVTYIIKHESDTSLLERAKNINVSKARYVSNIQF
jgi:hypothetical protein